MVKSNWHLDCKYSPEFFEGNWSIHSNDILLSLFKYLDTANKPVLSMLPQEIDAAGVAAAAVLYFLPGQPKPPGAPCKIALYPGGSFVQGLKRINFKPDDIRNMARTARLMQRGEPTVPEPIQRLERRLNSKSKDISQTISFHWIWRCRKVWVRYNELQSEDIIPRNYYGINDESNAVIDVIEDGAIDRVSKEFGPYDLLIYCPYLHSYSMHRNAEDLEKSSIIINNFSAYRKLVISKSPYEYWARRLEPIIGESGMAISSFIDKENFKNDKIHFHLVDQLVSLNEAFELHYAIKRQRSKADCDPSKLFELKNLLRYLLAGMDPLGDKILFEDSIEKLVILSKEIGLDDASKAGKIIVSIVQRANSRLFLTKRECLEKNILNSEDDNKSYQIWVTKESDRRILLDFKTKSSVDFNIQFVSKAVPSGIRPANNTVILSRIDRDVDLDLVSYLQPGDGIIMSTWEAVVREELILEAWEKSQKWREAANKNIGLNKINLVFDPVLDLADFLTTTISKNIELLDEDQKKPNQEYESWWDDRYESSFFTHINEERNFIMESKLDTVSCIEIILAGGVGVFFKHNSELQIIRKNNNDEDEFLSVSPIMLDVDDIVLFFKDIERNSIFDILIDQLANSIEYGNEANIVKKWKEKLRETFFKSNLNMQQVHKTFLYHKGRADIVSIKSWILGPTMAPLKIENFMCLIKTFDIKNINSKEIYEAVQKLRTIARVIGKALNSLIASRNLGNLDNNLRSILDGAGVDIEDVLSAVEARKVIAISNVQHNISSHYAGKPFKFSDKIDT